MKANNVSPILIMIMLILAINTACDKKKDHCDSKEILQKQVSIYVVDTTYNSIFGEVYKMQKFKNYFCIARKLKHEYSIYIQPNYNNDFDLYDCDAIVSYKDCLFILTRAFPIEIINYKKKLVGKVFYKRYYDRTEDFSPCFDDSFSFWNYRYKDNKLVLEHYYLYYRDKRPQFSK